MKMKPMIMLLSSLLVLTTAALGSIAYMTDTSSVTNTFTVGNVNIKVEETQVNAQGKPVDAQGNEIVSDSQQPVRREQGNTYHLVPGRTYQKDPTLTVQAGSDQSYVRMVVTITHIDQVRSALGADFLPQNFVEGWDAAKWQCVRAEDSSETVAGSNPQTTVQTGVYEFRYYKPVDGLGNGTPADLQLEPLFTHFTMPASLTNEQLALLQNMEIRVVGHAIQADGFADADAAWAVFPVQ